MTASSSSQESAYLYAQGLDNSGDTLCWLSRAVGEYQELDYADPQRVTFLHSLDHVQNIGRQWPVGSDSLECTVTYRGDCLIKIKPLTRDIGGRVAPVILLFNVFSDLRKNAARMLFDCEALMQRELSTEHHEAFNQLGKIMHWPRIIIALHILLYSKSSRK